MTDGDAKKRPEKTSQKKKNVQKKVQKKKTHLGGATGGGSRVGLDGDRSHGNEAG